MIEYPVALSQGWLRKTWLLNIWLLKTWLLNILGTTNGRSP
ncbi:hypothetical protein [Prochlorothrix hollandica]|nr:hypothetical protein [Prochlorothrix hollandica]